MKVNIKLLEEEMDKKHVSVSELALDIPSKKAGLIFFSTEVA